VPDLARGGKLRLMAERSSAEVTAKQVAVQNNYAFKQILNSRREQERDFFFHAGFGAHQASYSVCLSPRGSGYVATLSPLSGA
jgi:hypothetical protein